ncbi:MAG: transcriptional repressor [Dehalococcoidales bacterium]
MPPKVTNQDITRGNKDKLLSPVGLRNTAQRALIMDVIRKGKGHMDADEVYRLAKKKQPRLSLSTVYRTLQKLKNLDLIEELHFDEAHHHYEIKPPSEHHHLVCLGCGKIVEFKYPLAKWVRKNLPEAREFEITDSEVRMTGYCADCQTGNK